MTRTQLVIIALAGCALAVSGCKKEEKAPEVASAPAQQAAAPAAQSVVAYDFEAGISGWSAADKTVKLEQASNQKHNGNVSLQVSGTAGASRWNFAASPKVNLEPGKKYKLTGWMMVDSWDKAGLPPLLKYSVYKDNKWVSNAFTTKYNLNKTKEWQLVGTTFVAPQGGAINGFVSLEKGTQDPINATIYLDDIKIETAN